MNSIVHSSDSETAKERAKSLIGLSCYYSLYLTKINLFSKVNSQLKANISRYYETGNISKKDFISYLERKREDLNTTKWENIMIDLLLVELKSSATIEGLKEGINIKTNNLLKNAVYRSLPISFGEEKKTEDVEDELI